MLSMRARTPGKLHHLDTLEICPSSTPNPSRTHSTAQQTAEPGYAVTHTRGISESNDRPLTQSLPPAAYKTTSETNVAG